MVTLHNLHHTCIACGNESLRPTCLHADEYDPMITTPPGLYVVSAIVFSVIQGLASLVGVDVPTCGVSFLRALNVFPAALMPLIVAGILKMLHGWAYPQLFLHTLAIVTLPIYFFFVQLYYNEIYSTFFVLLTFYCGLRAVRLRDFDVKWVILSALVRSAPSPPSRSIVE